jgi:thioesterase domain-containing protein
MAEKRKPGRPRIHQETDEKAERQRMYAFLSRERKRRLIEQLKEANQKLREENAQLKEQISVLLQAEPGFWHPYEEDADGMRYMLPSYNS